MQLFEYPYIIITILVLCFIVLAAMGIYFAIRGAKTAKGSEEKDFINISKLEAAYEKFGKLREDRCVFYAKVSLDNFRSLYSSHQTSNVFSQIKTVLLEAFSKGDDSDIAIYGEKNFVVLSKCNIETARKKIENCFGEINKCLLKHSALNIIDVRIGVYFAFGTQVSFDDAIGRAKQAYLLAKNENIPCAEWNVSGGKALEKKIKIENNIEKEIDNNRFFLEYQPVLDAKTKKIIGAEVLSRLNSESEGVLTPGSFLSAVDSVGINDKFDYYIFEKNCKWISSDINTRGKYVYTINFSRQTLCGPNFPENIIRCVEAYGINFSCIAVEILEDKSLTEEAKSVMMQNLIRLKNRGILIFLDDFGTGFTSFSDLAKFDIDIVKIDKAITQGAVNPVGNLILKNMIKTAHDLGYKTICEGVETEEHKKAAEEAGSDMLQGYYFYHPLPVTKLEVLLKNA